MESIPLTTTHRKFGRHAESVSTAGTEMNMTVKTLVMVMEPTSIAETASTAGHQDY